MYDSGDPYNEDPNPAPDAQPPPRGALDAASQAPSFGGALSQATADPFELADKRLRDLTQEISPIDQLRALGASLIPDATTFAEQRKERRSELQKLYDAYLQRDAAPIQDPLQRMLIGMARAPSGTPVAGVMGAGADAAETAREADRSLRQARVSAAQKVKFEGLNQISDDTRSDAQLGVNLLNQAGTFAKPKQYSALVNEVLERRNQLFDKYVKLGVDASTPDSMAALEARIDREVAPMVKGLYADYPQYRDLIVQSMPQMFSTFQGGTKPVTPNLANSTTVGSSTLGAPGGKSPNPQPPLTATTTTDFNQFIEPPRATPQVGGILFRDKAAEQARVANAKTAAKYYDETVRVGGDAANTTINAAQQLRAIGPDTGKLAPLKKEIGNWMDALGIHDGAGIVNQAIKSNNAQMLLQQMANAILLQAKGVQTEGDAQRAFRQAAQIDDPKASWDYKLRAMEAAAWRLRYRQQLYQEYAKGRNGNYDGAEAAFSKFEQEVPFVKNLPTRAGGTQAVFFNEFVRNREANGIPKQQAFKEWGGL